MSRKEITVHESISEVNENQWNNLVSQSETGSVYQRVEWLRSVEEGFDSDPKHVVVTQDGNIVGACPNFEMPIELPDSLSRLSGFTARKAVSVQPGFGGPITTSMDTSVFDALFDGVEAAVGNETAYHQLNVLSREYLGCTTYLENRGYVPSVKSCRFVVNLDRGFEQIRDDMSKDRRYNLRKGEEQDYRVIDEDIDCSTVADFYDKYDRAMRRIGTESMPRRFFLELTERLDDRLKLFGLEVDGIPTGMHLYILDEERATVYHYVSAVNESHFEYYPSELLHAHAIKWGSDNGFSRYDFGETATDFTDGVFKYKKQFGGELLPTLAWRSGISMSRWYLFRLGKWYYRHQFDK